MKDFQSFPISSPFFSFWFFCVQEWTAFSIGESDIIGLSSYVNHYWFLFSSSLLDIDFNLSVRLSKRYRSVLFEIRESKFRGSFWCLFILAMASFLSCHPMTVLLRRAQYCCI